MLDIAFEIVRAKYPQIFANITVIPLYNADPEPGCVETGDIMYSMVGQLLRNMKQLQEFPIIISPGENAFSWSKPPNIFTKSANL